MTEVALARKLPFITGHDGVQQPEEEGYSWLHLSDMDSAAFRLLGFEVVERWSDPLPGMVWVTEETCRRYQLSSNRPHFGKKDDKGGYRYNVCGVIRDYRCLLYTSNQLGCQLEAIVAGSGLEGVEKQVLPFGVDKVHVFDAPGLFPYTCLLYTSQGLMIRKMKIHNTILRIYSLIF